MNIKLTAVTPDAVKVCASAAWICQHQEHRAPEDFTLQEAGDLVAKIMELGHDSIAEHAVFTFSISEVSRALSHQLVRHRIASYAQQSQRCVDELQPIVMPPSIAANDTMAEQAKMLIRQVENFYNNARALGIPAEDARYFSLTGAQTALTVTMNARELRNFFGLRMCKHAQWEIRALAELMYLMAKNHAPALFQGKFPACGSRGECAKCGGAR